MSRSAVAITAVVFLVGCAVQPVRPVQATAVRNRVFQRNYSLKERRTAFVGEPVIAVKDFSVIHRRGQHMLASTSFRVKQALTIWLTCPGDTPLPVIGRLAVEGRDYTLVSIRDDASHKIAVLVSADGRPYPKLLSQLTDPILIRGTADFDPPGVTFRQAPDDVLVDSTAGFVNYELLYGGTDGRSFTFSYREYTPQDLIKPGLTQTLTYENSARVARFRALALEVYKVTSSQLEYAVINDGLRSP